MPQSVTTRSVLAVPLVAQDRKLGAIYLESTDPKARLDDGHLQLLSAIAGVAASALEKTRRMTRVGAENQRLRADLCAERNMVGESRSMRMVHDLITKVAPADSTVLICGESGTGKELVARAIHQNSSRADESFMVVNCGALVETLTDSELFGHEKGAFTGAIAQKKGKLELANGGSLFLDEIGELAATLQIKLLRFLQERQFERVGGTRTLNVDVRVIAATNRNIDEAIRTGDFREDLYYRLNVISITVPPLRERREDIPLLARYFVLKYGKACHRRTAGISPEALKYLNRLSDLLFVIARVLARTESGQEVMWNRERL